MYSTVPELAPSAPLALPELLGALAGKGVAPAALGGGGGGGTAAPPSAMRTILWEQLEATPTVLGSGTFGTVRMYMWVKRGGMEVAVKELHSATLSMLQPRDVAMLKDEAELQARLEHDHVARVYAIAESVAGAESRYGLVMKLYDRPLGRVLGKTPSLLALKVREVYILQVASGLAYIHGERVVHGDLKPDNVLIAKGGADVALTDFGLGQ